MKVAVLGGTGKMGGGIAKQLARSHEVMIGSRDEGKAKEAAEGIRGAKGGTYSEASRWADVVVFSLPYSAMGAAATLAEETKGKLVVSVVNPLRVEKGIFVFALEKGSAAEEMAAMLPASRVATAFNNVPARMLGKDEVAQMDILVAADSKETFEETARLVESIHNMRALHVGPLSEAGMVERVTALVLNLAKLNDTGALTTRFYSEK